MKIAFIGGGNMGEAMLAAVLSRKLSTPDAITVGEIDEARRNHLQQTYKVAATGDNRKAAQGADIVVLAVKPQTMPLALADLSGHLKASQLVLSIAAGVRIEKLRQGLGHRAIVRSMPNTPAQIGEGMTVWTATTEVTDEQRELAAKILGAMGKEIFVDDEKYLDMATAVSGSGPAYFFLFVESLVDAAVKIGLPRDAADKLVLQTMIGSAHLIEKSGRTPADLRRMVTSPGGTTAEAISRFEQGGFEDLVRQAVRAAYEKAKKLGG